MKKNKFLLLLVLILIHSQLSFAQSSVLASGDWYKVAVTQDGIYCITYTDLVALGINVSVIDPRNISIYGNKAGMLPVKNNVTHINDLNEIAIKIKGEADGIFDPGTDTIFFYGQSSVVKMADTINHRLSHIQNTYSDSTYYFLTIGSAFGKRIPDLASQPTFTNSTTSYTDLEWHELDTVNFLHSGKVWYGEKFSNQSSRNFSFDISHITTVDSMFIQVYFAGRTLYDTADLNIVCENISADATIHPVGSSIQDNYATDAELDLSVPPPVNTGVIQCNYFGLDTNATGWLNYFEVNLIRNLYLFKSQQIFTDLRSSGPGNITNYIIDNATASLQIWDITDPINILQQQYISSFPSVEFNAENYSAHTYIAFDGHAYLRPHLIGQIPNQNLHLIGQEDMIIVTTPEFYNEASTLANYHITQDGLQVIVVNTNEIYNEYSSGVQDIVAIRDFIRQVYQRSAAVNDSLKYVLLFGGASYDYKNHLGNFSSFVPTFETSASLNALTSLNSDDFFSFMNDTAGDSPLNRVEIGIGRIPVKNLVDASVINKIINYKSGNTINSWRKRITVVSDGGDHNIWFNQIDTIANQIENNHCEYDIRKIYLDAYVRDTSGGHISYPGANYDIERSIQNGCLVMDYNGHGGEKDWAFARVLDIQFLQSVSNNNNLPLFNSSTASFNRFDDPGDTSCGQVISLRNSGAGIASISDTRIGFSSSDFIFNSNMHRHLFEKVNNQFLRLGDVIKKTKQDHADLYTFPFCLLGDPALQLNYPKNDVVTTLINGHPVSSQTDTLIPGQSMRIDGEIHDENGNLISSFNGTVNILVFDRKSVHLTLANDLVQYFITSYYAWDDTLHFETVPVINGMFSDTFYLPYNVDSGFGTGKISYYAQDNSTDASGCFENIGFQNLHYGIDELQGMNVSVFPNPANQKAEIYIEGIKVNNFDFSLTDLSGKIINRMKINDNRFYIERNSLSDGIYYYEIRTQKNQLVKRGKIVFE